MTRLSVHCLRHLLLVLAMLAMLAMLAVLVMLAVLATLATLQAPPCKHSMTRPFVHSQRHPHVRTFVLVLALAQAPYMTRR